MIDRRHDVTQNAVVDPALISAIRFVSTRRRIYQKAEGNLARQIKAIQRTAKKGGLRQVDEVLLVADLDEARSGLVKKERSEERALRELARQLPVWGWVKSVRGISDLGLGIVVAEAHDLSRYDNPAKLWKRFGLYPGAKATKGATLAFSPARRSVAIVLAEGFIKQGDEYRMVYLDRKAYEAEQHPELTKAHIHNRARRYVAKRFLRDLWREWRSAKFAVAPGPNLSIVTLPEEVVA